MLAQKIAAGGYQTETLAWIAAVDAASGITSTLSTTEKDAADAFIVSAKANSYFSAFQRVGVWLGSLGTATQNFNGALIPLYAGGGSLTADTVSNITSSDYNTVSAFTGNGSNKSVDTGLNLNATTANSLAFGCYIRTNLQDNANCMGASNGSDYAAIIPYGFANLLYGDNLFNGATGRATGSNTDSRRLCVCSRTASNRSDIYRDSGTSLGNTTGGQGTLFSGNFKILQRGDNTNYCQLSIVFYFISTGLSSTQVGNLVTDVNTFMTSVGRNV